MRIIKDVILFFLSVLGFIQYKLTNLNNKDNNLTLSINNKGVFFGYYDVMPFNSDNSKLLANICNSDYFISPKEDNYLEVGYFDLSNSKNEFVKIGDTNTWCWQQGARLQWMPKSENHIFYNKDVDGNYGSVIYDLKNNQIIRELHSPIYSIHPKEKRGLSLNFSRLQRLRPGYGYNTYEDKTKDEKAMNNDGLWEVNLENDTKKLLISLNDITELKSDHHWSERAEHYINHIFYNPVGDYFFFFHLWTDGNKRASRLIIYSEIEKNFKVLDNDCEAVSHYNFKNDYELLVTLVDKNGKLVYRLYNFKDNSKIDIKSEHLQRDSHPSFIDNLNILYDSYPNIYRLNTLNILNYSSNENSKILLGYHPRKFIGECRCDLHPRLSKDKKLVAIDTVESNERVIKIIKL